MGPRAERRMLLFGVNLGNNSELAQCANFVRVGDTEVIQFGGFRLLRITSPLCTRTIPANVTEDAYPEQH
jgi:hypothetical protein